MNIYKLYICILFYLSFFSCFIESTHTDSSLFVSTPAETQSEDSAPVEAPSTLNGSDSSPNNDSATETQPATPDSTDSGNLKGTDASQGGANSSGSEPNTDPKKIAEDMLNKLKSEVKLFKADSSGSSDVVELTSTEYSYKKGFYQDEVDFTFSQGVKCTLVRCNDKDVWKYDSTKFGGSHPTVVSYVGRSKLVVYFGTKYIFYEKGPSDDWGVAKFIVNLSISNLAHGTSKSRSNSVYTKTGAGLNEEASQSADGKGSESAGADAANKGSHTHSPEEDADAHTATSTPSTQSSPAPNLDDASPVATPPTDHSHHSSVDTSGFGISWDLLKFPMDPNCSAQSLSTDSSHIPSGSAADISSACEGTITALLHDTDSCSLSSSLTFFSSAR